MARRIILGLVFAGLLALVYVGYINWMARRAMLSGEVLNGPGDVSRSEDSSMQPASEPAERQSPTLPAAKTSSSVSASTAVPHAGDTISPNPPNGTVFAGTGPFQVYRQGNITWRINTNTGQTCVLLATNEEWRKPQVYQHGCGNSAVR